MSKKVAIIHEEIHPLLDKICDRLQQLGCEAKLVHWSKLGMEVGSLHHSLAEFDVIYLDRMGELLPSYTTQLLLLVDLMERFPNLCIKNNPKAYLFARNKALMAIKFDDAKLPVPKTMIAYTKGQIEDFCKKNQCKSYIAKSFLGCCAEDIFTFSNIAIPVGVDDILIRDGVVIVQEFIYNPERYIWRIDVVNSKVVQCNQRFAFNKDEDTPLCNGTVGGDIIFWEPEKLPKEVYELAVKAVNQLGLIVAGVDILVSAEGELFIAEVNPEPDITLNKLGFPYSIAEYLNDIEI